MTDADSSLFGTENLGIHGQQPDWEVAAMAMIDLATCLATIPNRRRAEGRMHGRVGVIPF